MPPARSEREHADDCATHWDLAAECTCTQSSGAVTAEEFDRRQFHRSGRDRADWARITIYCCGDCGWRESIDQQCPGCGQTPVPVLYERQTSSR